MIENKNMTSYLLYAVGEVFLVVVGILIAIQVDNWNEQRKADKRAENLLLQIQEEALLTIERIDDLFKYYSAKDSAYAIVVSDKLTIEDYMKPEYGPCRNIIFSYEPFSYQKEGFTTFVEQVDQFSPKYQVLSKTLKKVYIGNTDLMEKAQQDIHERVIKHHDFAATQSWYYSWIRKEVSTDFANYLANDSLYRNGALRYITSISDYTTVLYLFQSRLVDLYLEIHKMTGSPKELPTLINEYYGNLSLTEKEKLVGIYRSDKRSSSIEITLEKGQLLMSNSPIKILKDGRILRLQTSAGALSARPFMYNLKEQKICFQPLYKKQYCYYKQ